MIQRIEIPMDLKSRANERGHWRKRWLGDGGTTKQRSLVRAYLLADLGGGKHPTPKVVRMIRHGKAQLDSDNLAGAFKAVRDEIAAFFGVSDGPKGPIRWECDQGPAKRSRTPYIVIEME